MRSIYYCLIEAWIFDIIDYIQLDAPKNFITFNAYLKACISATCRYTPMQAIEVPSCSPVAPPYAVIGTPPSFNQEPQDTMVFQRNRASLTLNCNASGDPPPTIVWYRQGAHLSDKLVLANGSLLIRDIREGMDATRGGLSYHCTANNTFGTIRSRAANVAYACELREVRGMWQHLYDVCCANCFRF